MDQPQDSVDKAAHRRRIRQARRAAGAHRDRAADDRAICDALLTALADTLAPLTRGGGHPPYRLGEPCVAIYRALPTEPPTARLAAGLHERGIPVIVPELLPDLDLAWHELLADGQEGPSLGRAGIAAARVIVTPALGIDRDGTRLGQGGGSYDRALARRDPAALVVSVVNDGEYAAQPLPREPHDTRVHAVVTPGRGYLPIGR